MSDIAIRVENLGKQYRIGKLQENGGRYSYKSLRDALASSASAPFRAVRALVDRGGKADNRRDEIFWALRDVSFEVKRGEIVGVIGRNGAGKSTLLKLMSRITEPTVGRAEIRGRVGSLLEVGTGFHPELSGRDNVYLNGAILGMKRTEIARQFDAMVAFAEVEKFIDTPVKHYSSGMYLRLAFAVAAHLETEVLLVDEVLAVGDLQFQEKCLGKMQDVAASGRTVFFVSHSMSSVQRLCKRAIALASGGVIADSTPDDVIASYVASDLGDSYTEPPNSERPTITKASILLENDSLVLSVEFQSPFPLTPPVLGFVMYNSLGAPIFGTNTRADPLSPTPKPSTMGCFTVSIPCGYFRPDRYLFSIWLADSYVDYCARERILKVDLNSGIGGGLPVRVNGNTYLPTQWSYEALNAR